MTPCSSNLPSSKYSVIEGTPIVSGFAIGEAVYSQVPVPGIERQVLSQDQVDEELKRIRYAIDQVWEDLSSIRLKMIGTVGMNHADIFMAQQMILKDIDLFNEIEKDLRGRLVSAENIIYDVFLRLEQKFRSISNPLIQARADDIGDIAQRLLAVLQGRHQEKAISLPSSSILFTHRLLPSEIASLNVKNLKAIVSQEATINSHSAILARALDIPFVSNVEINQQVIVPGTVVVVDGKNGRVIVHPKQSQINAYSQLIHQRLEERHEVVESLKNVPLRINGEDIKVRANASSLPEIKMTKQNGADGVGLYRIESLYMARTDFPGEEELYLQLRETLEPARDLDITLRLLDIGGDKTLPFWNQGDIKNPALGLNGIRLLFKYPRLLEMQIRVFLRLSADFRIKALVSMVSLAQDMVDVRTYFLKEMEKLRAQGIAFDEHMRIGAMVETPAALLAFDELLDVSDFFNIGTNDLVQYVMAAARGSEEVVDYYEAGNRLILKSLKGIIHQSKLRGKECWMCGELAGNPDFTQELLEIGLRNFSVQPIHVPEIKNKIAVLLENKFKKTSLTVESRLNSFHENYVV